MKSRETWENKNKNLFWKTTASVQRGRQTNTYRTSGSLFNSHTIDACFLYYLELHRHQPIAVCFLSAQTVPIMLCNTQMLARKSRVTNKSPLPSCCWLLTWSMGLLRQTDPNLDANTHDLLGLVGLYGKIMLQVQIITWFVYLLKKKRWAACLSFPG